MGESNGSSRLDRIEAILERLAKAQERDHEEFTSDHKQLMTWQVLRQKKMDRWAEQNNAERAAQREKNAALDARVDKLASSIGELISRIPPAALQV